MSTFPFFDPSRPPPLPTTFPPPFIDPFRDRNIVQEFLSTRPQPSITPTAKQQPESITTLRANLIDLIAEVDRLQLNKEALEKEIASQPDSEWDANVEQLELLQRSIVSKLLHLNDPDQRKLLGKKLYVRQKKRAWLKRRNNRLAEEQDEMFRNREKLHEQINQWQREQSKQLEKEKQAQQELDYAGHFLADVHRRKAACKRYLAKFDKMKDKDSQTEIGELIGTWTAKLSECVKEEKRLKDVLARKSAANYQRRVENEWNKALFGDAIPKKFEHPLLGADRNREVLVGIRRDWDACLVEQNDEEGSAVPLGWVLPPVDPAPNWAKYRITDAI